MKRSSTKAKKEKKWPRPKWTPQQLLDRVVDRKLSLKQRKEAMWMYMIHDIIPPFVKEK